MPRRRCNSARRTSRFTKNSLIYQLSVISYQLSDVSFQFTDYCSLKMLPTSQFIIHITVSYLLFTLPWIIF
ncbi:MAG: hypothetical protein EWV82_04910 [Microcystis aeruginosa Ma_AC_P_19900807_S299]|nr:MAG: hypothetical protein EWV82_04910 [Microcystis aeruginosa Ma_AC_P_19900807_S299]